MATLAKHDAARYGGSLLKSASLDALASVWLFVSAFLFLQGNDVFFINNVTAGALAAILAFGGFAHVWLAWLPAAIGAWVIVSPFVLGFTDNSIGTWNNVLVGIAMLGFALRSWSVTRSARDAGVMDD